MQTLGYQVWMPRTKRQWLKCHLLLCLRFWVGEHILLGCLNFGIGVLSWDPILAMIARGWAIFSKKPVFSPSFLIFSYQNHIRDRREPCSWQFLLLCVNHSIDRPTSIFSLFEWNTLLLSVIWWVSVYSFTLHCAVLVVFLFSRWPLNCGMFHDIYTARLLKESLISSSWQFYPSHQSMVKCRLSDVMPFYQSWSYEPTVRVAAS